MSFRSLNARKWFFGVLEIETHTINLERILDRVAPSLVVFMIVLLDAGAEHRLLRG